MNAARAPRAGSVEAGRRAADRSERPSPPDPESREWVADLRAPSPRRDLALARLHGLLLRAARFQVYRRRSSLAHVQGPELDDLAHQSADDALVAILAKLDGYRGESRFTTWTYKFALLEAGVKVRRRSWQGREVALEPDAWSRLPGHGFSPEGEAQQGELLGELRRAIAERLTPHQREVLVALTLDGVPIDVLAERLTTTRGALYKTLHDARQKLRRHLAERGLQLSEA